MFNAKKSCTLSIATIRPIPYIHQTSFLIAIRTTFSHMINIAVIIYYTCSLFIDIQCVRYKNAFSKRFKQLVCQNNSAKINSEKKICGNNAVYFRLCIDLMYITPLVTAEGYDGTLSRSVWIVPTKSRYKLNG